MDRDRIDAALSVLREKGDCQLRACKHVNEAEGGFISMPPHRVGIAHLTLRPRFLLGDPVGCGKTAEALVSFAFLKEKDPSLRLLVITDKSALYQWRAAVNKFLVGIKASVVGYDEKKRSAGRDARHAQWALDDSDVLITTWHGAALDIDLLLSKLDNFIVAMDEVQRVRTHTGKLLHPAAQKLAQKARYTWGLSATPVYNRPEDLYGVFEAIWPGFFGSFQKFSESYIRTVLIKPKRGRWFKKVVGYKNLEHLAARIRPFYLKRPVGEFNAHMPPIVIDEKRLEMNDKQRDAYEQILAERLHDKKLTPLTKLCYLQMASDAPQVLGFDGVKSSKMEELLRFFSEDIIDEKVIIYARYETVVTYICEQLKLAGIKVARITGKESTVQREQSKAAFNEPNSGLNVICINGAGAQAIDLQAAGIVICYDLPWSWGELTQVIGRARRIGSKHSKVLVILLANAHKNSIDSYTLERLNAKEAIAKETLELPETELTLTAPVTDHSVEALWELVGAAA